MHEAVDIFDREDQSPAARRKHWDAAIEAHIISRDSPECFVMPHVRPRIQFRDSALDSRNECELLDGVIDRRVSRQLSQQVDDAITCEPFSHDRILRFVALIGRERRRVAAWVGPNLGP